MAGWLCQVPVRLLQEVRDLRRHDPGRSHHRQLLGDRQQGWHGANSYTHAEVLEALSPHWELLETRGVLWLPIHRFPNLTRPLLLRIDQGLNRSPFKRYASYRMYVLRKR